jgi:hypothetical protein
MSARLLRCLFVVAVIFATIPAYADWLCDFFQSIPQDTKRRNCWPQPFTCPDRQATRTPFAIEVANGWRRQNLLGDHYFEPNSGELTEAGRLKVHWIVFEAPAQHRVIFVHNANTAEETAARMNTVHAYAAKIMPQGELPSISETRISDEGWPADHVEVISRKYQSTTPAPRLPANTSGTGSGSGGSSGGGGSGN